MNFFDLKIDKQGVHLHFHHIFFLLLTLILLVVLVTSSLFLYKYYMANYYDSSLGSKELQDLAPVSPPTDIQKKIQQIEQFPIPASTSSAIIRLPMGSTSAALRVPILMYHYIEYVKDKNDKLRIALNTTPDVLDAQIKTLSDAGFTFMTNKDLADVLDGKIPLPSNPVVLTFDDGYRDFYTDAYPILKKYHAKATQYVIAGFLDNPNHLTKAQLSEIATNDLVEIGAHTVHHVWLRGSSLKKVSDEVFQSRVMLEQLIKKSVISFAYPFGAFDDQAIQVVEDAGFRSATSTLPGITQTQTNRFFLFRLRAGARVGNSLLNFLKQPI